MIGGFLMTISVFLIGISVKLGDMIRITKVAGMKIEKIIFNFFIIFVVIFFTSTMIFVLIGSGDYYQINTLKY